MMNRKLAWFSSYIVALGCFASCANSHNENGEVRTASLDALDSGPSPTSSTAASASGPTHMCALICSSGNGCVTGEVPEKDGCVDTRQIVAAVTQYAAQINACARQGGPTGLGRVRMIFDPGTGRQTSTWLEPPYDGTAEGACVLRLVESIAIAPVQGAP
ncbi:MAG: hypothetical protein ACREP9_13665, partial [Candidatus Dormibacteraceae bacterium]